ncbi:hypothetical protein BKA70DRAFT_1235848 [Coprinopsis sp. MPI-PUGE-AT-0042]|nr:hypothetical protein BKA70DRAFT_1235848 [Coprinopsis sp. MPI-PUGE-AT-0042]
MEKRLSLRRRDYNSEIQNIVSELYCGEDSESSRVDLHWHSIADFTSLIALSMGDRITPHLPQTSTSSPDAVAEIHGRETIVNTGSLSLQTSFNSQDIPGCGTKDLSSPPNSRPSSRMLLWQDASTNPRMQAEYDKGLGKVVGPSTFSPPRKRMPAEGNDCPVCYNSMHGAGRLVQFAAKGHDYDGWGIPLAARDYETRAR